MTNSIETRLNKLNKKAEARVARRMRAKLETESKERNKAPNKPNFLTAKQIREARKKFGNQCMICGKRPTLIKANAVDHCHVTGIIRGILCQTCNMGLGYFKEDIELLKSAVRYLVVNKFSADQLDDEAWERLISLQNR